MKYKSEHSVIVQIPHKKAWDKLSDLSLASWYVPGVKSVEYLTTQKSGIGAIRMVYPQGIKEEVISWETGREILFKLTKKGKESFFPFKKAIFRYSLMENEETYIKLSLEYTPLFGEAGYFLFGRFIQKRIRKTAEGLKQFYEV